MVLVDKSAWVIAGQHELASAAILREIAESNVATNAVITLEMLYSARNAAEHRRQRRWIGTLKELDLGSLVCERAIELQGQLAQAGRHRMPITDLLIAACAEHHTAELLHYDKHFDQIAEVSGLEARWIVPRGGGH